MWFLILILLVVVGVQVGTDDYYSYSNASANVPYYRFNKYRWYYGPGYYSESNLGSISANYEPRVVSM